jgi:hypothetical protein
MYFFSLILNSFLKIRAFESPVRGYFFHLMLQPILGRWRGETALPAISASSASRTSLPESGTLLDGRESSNWPR